MHEFYHSVSVPQRNVILVSGMKNLSSLVTDFLEYLEVERGRSMRTIRNYDFYLRRFTQWAGNPSAKAITREMVHKYRLWLNRLQEGRQEELLKKSTQNYHLIALRSFLKYLVKQEIVSLPPEQIELSKHVRREVEFLEAEELTRLLAMPRKHSQESLITLRDIAILELLFATGLRVSELAGLKIDQLNLKRDEFTVRGKGNKPRIVFLSAQAKLALKDYLGKRRDTSAYLFVSHDRAKKERADSGPLTPRSVQRIVEGYAKAAGITKKITPHTLRHTFATDLLLSGADIRSVQSMLGHESITTTQVYTHITNNQMKEVYQKFHGKNQKDK